ncbi:MAG: ATP-binding protein, partial [Actinobacteria bacterium]|nr:ATP-binding protein [Actinomycetota bacterium]
MAVSMAREVAPAAAVVMPVTVEGAPSSWGFVGREQELAALLALLDPRRPDASAGIVVSGMAGVGKTALAWQAARTAVGRGWFSGGAVIVDLHGYDPEAIAQVALEQVYVSLLRALDPDWPVAVLPVTVDEQASAYYRLMSHLGQVSRPVLLVVDNADNTHQITGLVPTGQAHRLLITSRHPLEGLPRARRLEVDALTPELAIELLGTRRPGDPRLGADPAAAAELARLCGHVPLALQIIAVLMADDPARPTAELVAELADETSRLQSLPGEQWPGRAAVGLAYRRLDDFSARLFRLLAVAPVPDVAAEAAAALANQSVEQVRPALAALA